MGRGSCGGVFHKFFSAENVIYISWRTENREGRIKIKRRNKEGNFGAARTTTNRAYWPPGGKIGENFYAWALGQSRRPTALYGFVYYV